MALGLQLHRRVGRRPPCHLRRLDRPARPSLSDDVEALATGHAKQRALLLRPVASGGVPLTLADA